MAKRRLGRDGAQVDLYYRFKLPEVHNEKVLEWKKGMSLKGLYMGKTVRGEYTDYVFEGTDGKIFSVNRTSAIESALEGVEAGSLIELTYEGKKKLAGGKSFHIVDIFLLDGEEAVSEEDAPL